MATYAKFNQFIMDLGSGVHDLQASGDTLKVYLTYNAPNAEAHTVKADLPGITEENGYTSTDIQNEYTMTDGVTALVGEDAVYTAVGGDFGPFRYAVLYNATATAKAEPLIAYWDYDEDVTITEGNQYTINFGAEIFELA